MTAELDLSTLGYVVGITTTITTAATYVIVNREVKNLKTEICGKISKLHERCNDIAIRLGILEKEEN